MPDKEGSEDNKTKSVVSKKQKQMMGEEGYDVARDMGRVRPSKDKKDATTMPPSKEMMKTRKVNKGPSALDIVKKKYKGQIMKMEELDLTKVAESFGGYVVSEKLTSLTGDPEEIASRIKKGAAAARKKRIQQGAKNLAKDAGIKLTTQSPEQAAATQAAKDIGQKDLTPDVRKGMRSVAAGKGKAEPKDQFAATSGGKKKGEFKSPKLSPTTSGRKITKRIVKKIDKTEADKIEKRLEPKTRTQKIASDRADARDAARKFKKDAPTDVTGDFSPTMDTKLRKVRQAKRDARAKKLGTPDPFTTPTPKKPIRPFGDKPVAGGLPMDPTRTYTTTKGGRKITKVFDPSKPPKRTPIPKDTGSLADAPKVKKRFSQLSKDIKGLKTDIKVEKDIEKTISRVGSGRKISKTADFSSTSQRTGAMKRGSDFVKSMRKKGGEALSKVSKAVSGTGASAGLAKVGGGKAVEKAALKKIGQKAVQKAGTKAATKAVAKSALKAIPGIGAFVAGAEAAGRLATGDVKGAALSAGEAIPGVGLGFAAANVARDVGRAKKAAKAIKTYSATQKLPKAMTRIPKGPMTKMPRGTKEVSLGKGMEIVKPGSGTIQKAPKGGISRKRVGQIAGGTAAYTAQKGFQGELPDLKMKGVKGGRTGFRSAKS